jgi:excisionase family DNA binding protein
VSLAEVRPALRPAEAGRLHGTVLSGLPDLLTVEEFTRWARIGRNQAYQAIHRGDVHAVRFGRSLRVPKAELERLLKAP